MAEKWITTDDSRVLVMNSSFAVSSLPNYTFDKGNSGVTRYVLFPKSLLDISKMSNISHIYFNVKYDLTRSAGSATTHIYGVYGTTSSKTEFRNVFIAQSSNQTDYVLQANMVAGTSSGDDDIQKYVNDTYKFTYNGNEYYCVEYYGSFGSALSKFTGSVNVKRFAFGVEYDESTKIYNGSNGITSAYLGSTKLNGIYLGSQKLL